MSELTGSHAVLLAAKFCRLSPLFRWCEEALWQIGSRVNKFHFRVELTNLLDDRCGEMLLSIFPASLSLLQVQRDTALYKLKALLVTIKHPYILPTVDIAYSREQKALVVVQPFVASGSLRDRIFRCAPTKVFSDKYRAEKATPLCLTEIRRFGAQILMALIALRQRGIVVEHLSSSNIIIDDGNARLSDLCNTMLSIDRYRESRERTIALEARGVAIDILLFGHLLYEMATGLELLSTTPDERVLSLMDPSIAQVLRMIFFPDNTPELAADDASSTEEEEEEDEQLDDSEEKSGSSVGEAREPEQETARRGPDKGHTLEWIQQCELFKQADLPMIESLFTGFRLDSSMKSTIKNSMRINQSRNEAYLVQYKDKEAILRARRRAERRLADDRERQQQRILMKASNKVAAKHKNLMHRSRSEISTASSTGSTVKMSRKLYRADSARLQRSSVSSA